MLSKFLKIYDVNSILIMLMCFLKNVPLIKNHFQFLGQISDSRVDFNLKLEANESIKVTVHDKMHYVLRSKWNT